MSIARVAILLGGVRHLSADERMFLALRFGFLNKPHTLEQLAEVFKVTREEAREEENRLLGLLADRWDQHYGPTPDAH